MKSILLALSVLFLGSMAQAGVANYTGECKYIDAAGQIRVDTQCDTTLATSTLGPAQGIAYFVTFPNGTTIDIGEQADGSFKVNGISANLASNAGKVVAITVEGEIFIFEGE